MIKWFIRKLDVDMSDAVYEDINVYQTFNEFFTRPIKKEVRPVITGGNTLAAQPMAQYSRPATSRKCKEVQAPFFRKARPMTC
jgi:hypothetical protein